MTRHRKSTENRSEGVIGYIRVSTTEQAQSGLGLGAQRAAIVAECERRGVELLDVVEDAGLSGKNLARPALAAVLDALDAGRGSILMTSKLDRLSRSVRDAADLLERSSQRGWKLVALDLGIDTCTPSGEAMANILATFAQLERRLIGQRTKDALAQKRAQGVKLGRPRTVPDEIRDRIIAEHDAGRSWSAIARGLDEEKIPTAQGGQRWYPATVRAVALSAGAVDRAKRLTDGEPPAAPRESA